MCDHLNLTVRNLEESLMWYQEVFGFEIVERGHWKSNGKTWPWSIVRRENFMLCLYEDSVRKEIPENDTSLHRIFHFGLMISDLEKFKQQVMNKDLIPYLHGPFQYPHSTSWYIKDPTGHEIEAVAWKDGIRF